MVIKLSKSSTKVIKTKPIKFLDSICYINLKLSKRILSQNSMPEYIHNRKIEF